jgi:hypothetical protein
MSIYNLNLNINQSDLENLTSSGSNIVIGKQIGAQNVAWIVFRPLSVNSVSWVEEYGIYVSNTPLQDGATIVQTSNIPASPGTKYALSASGTLIAQGGGAPAGCYSVSNQNYTTGSSSTVGLSQSASVNGSQLKGNAASAATVLFQTTTVISPSPSVVVWIQAEIQSSTVVTSVQAPQTQVSFGGGVTQASLVYDGNSGTFRPA